MPLNVASARDAMRLVLKDKAVIEDYSPHTFLTPTGSEFRIPYVVRLTYEIRQNKHLAPVKYSRRGVLIRDNYTCAYCGKYGDTIDHIHPQTLGGKSTFENCVTACTKCNNKKGHKTLDELGWKIKRPENPVPKSDNRLYDMLRSARHDEEMFKTWIEYISWYDANAKAEKLQLFPTS